MNIRLTSVAKQDNPGVVPIKLEERLPSWINGAPLLTCTYHVKDMRDYYSLTLQTKGVLSITCQRCLEQVEHFYEHSSEVLLCRTDEVADRLMGVGESIVVEHDEVNLNDIITDDLYFYAPDKPHDITSCEVNFKN